MHSGSPAPGTVLCRLDDVADPGARGFVFGAGTARIEIFIVRRGRTVYGFRNTCPHAGTPLDMLPDRFLTQDGTLIVCATHGARFRIEDGTCVAGPCVGKALATLPLALEDGIVRLG